MDRKAAWREVSALTSTKPQLQERPGARSHRPRWAQPIASIVRSSSGLASGIPSHRFYGLDFTVLPDGGRMDLTLRG